ncbi:cation diffusion facilitator family transporter [Chryseobacterium profundimaris]|uniref:Cation diffusion facilitator family transporter n=1 Tax=Chryseobacterium profundimaris TaxID=1387275 RepID=A0ABY1PGF8_9FLAO|nr:cation diffusion facilitator family transporter [Chryseobacterium profundimaris]SMP33828.1 cation diffusion facilitator family transporter [Chryseobacterium profundimaris]
MFYSFHVYIKMANNRKSIYSALAANLLIALTKFIAGAFTNSSSMISEGIHSTVDTTNQLLLLYGIKRSKKAPDESHPFGYGKELYFWSFVVSILIFGLGGGLSIYQGIIHIKEPEVMKDPFWNYIVLVLSLIFEGTSLIISVKEFNKTRNGTGWWDSIIKSKDPSSFLVVFEDGAAVAGLIVVMILMGASHSYQIPELDGVASIIVGLILVFVSLILARESRSLLMGEGIAPETKEKIMKLAEKDPTVIRTKSILSTYQSPEEIVLMLIIDFKDHLETEEITEAVHRIRETIKNEFPLVRFVIIQPE